MVIRKAGEGKKERGARHYKEGQTQGNHQGVRNAYAARAYEFREEQATWTNASEGAVVIAPKDSTARRVGN